MPMIEDADYNELVKQARLATETVASQKLLNKIGAGKNRRKLLELIKEEHPDASIPELDAAAPVLDEVKQTRVEVAELKKQLAEDAAAKAQADRERSTTEFVEKNRRILREQGWMPEGIEKVEKLMTERGLTDYEAAAALVERLEPKDQPVIPNYDRNWNFQMPDEGKSADEHKLLVSGVSGARKWQGKKIQEFFREKQNGTLRL